jgi:hypothetical protein
VDLPFHTDAKEIEILDAGSNLTNLKNKIGEYDRIVNQFRLLVKTQQVSFERRGLGSLYLVLRMSLTY